jgi:hypothetical protein
MANIGYVDTAYADEYVQLHYRSTDSLRLGWEALETADKEALLRQSFEAMDLLPFCGHKSSCTQQLAFPRWPDEDVPDSVKNAQVENAVSLADTSSAEDAETYERMRRYGVTSYTIGNLSESLGSTSAETEAALNGIVSAKSWRLLQPYLRGCYRIRGGSR